MAKDGGWEDLFSPLNDDEAMPPLLGETGPVPSLFPELPDPVLEATPFEAPAQSEPAADEPAAPVAPIAFVAPAPPAASAEPGEPSEPATPAEPAPSEPVAPADPSAALYAALQEDVEQESAARDAAAPEADVESGLTRRELRERREAAERSGAIDLPATEAAGAETPEQPATEPFTPVFAAEAVAPAAAPEAEAPEPAPSEPAPWDPAPELAGEASESAPGDDVPTIAAAAAATAAAAAAGTPPRVDAPTIPVSYDAPKPAAGGGGGEPPRQGPGGGFPMPLDPPPPAKRRVSLRWLAWFIPVVLVLGGLAYGANYAWQNYETQVRELLGMEIPNDYEGTGNGVEVVVTINQGDTGAIIARKLHDAGVTMTWDAFYNLMLDLANTGGEPAIQFGNFRLQEEMSAQAALNALLDPSNKITNDLYIPEGARNFEIFEIIATTLEIPIEEVQAAAADPAAFGVANPVGTLEGYLAPDTYHLDGTEDVTMVLQRLVDMTVSRLEQLGVPQEDWHRVLTMASVVQREAGGAAGDAAKVARVFYNRLEQDMLWQSDAAVAYGAGNFSSVWNTSAMFDDASNLWNTYLHKGYPPGPIGAPSPTALDAAVNPIEGPWLFFVTINLQTGETHFSETVDEHEAYVDVLREWCNASDENASYCR